MPAFNSGSSQIETSTPEQVRLEVCNQQLTGAMRELRNAIQKVEDIREFTALELSAIDSEEITDNPLFARANELLFESSIMLQAFVED